MKIKSIKKYTKKIKGKIIFLRVDFNVSLFEKKIKEEEKIIAALPTIRFLLRYNCKIIIATHLGDPKGKKIKNLSVEPIANRLKKLLPKRKVKFIKSITGPEVEKEINNLKGGQILFLENLRFDKGEENNDFNFAKKLSKQADIYVNEAFSVSHRKHASVNAIKKYLPSFHGILLEQEMANLNKINSPKKPLVLIMGGVKMNTKINLIKKLKSKAETILIGGALANNFLKARGFEIGKSTMDNESVKIAKKLKDKKIILPIDFAVNNKKNDRRAIIRKIGEIKKKDIILDIGPETVKFYSQIIKKARTIVWNGPMGYFENPHFRHGTMALAQVIAARSRGKTFGVAGGGETIELLKKTKMENYLDWVSTGGGAMLSYLGGEKMPGL